MNKKSNTLLIWDLDGLPPQEYQNIVLWKSFSCDLYPNAISVPKLVEENSAYLKRKYLRLIYNLGKIKLNGQTLINHLELERGFNYWWMTLIHEKCNWSKSLWINDAIRLFAFEDWVKNQKINYLELFSDDVSLQNCFRLFCEKKKINFSWKHPYKYQKKSSIRNVFYLLFPEPIKVFLWLLYFTLIRWPLKGKGIKEWRSTKGKITFVSYLFNLAPEAVEEGYFKSQYWAHLPDKLCKDGIATNWLHIYIKDHLLPSPKNGANLIAKFNELSDGQQTHTTLDSFLSWQIIKSTLVDWMRLRKIAREIKILHSSKLQTTFYLWPYLQRDLNESLHGQTALNNILYFKLFQQAFESLPNQSKCFYLQENQGWEFGLIQAWRTLTHGDLVGVPHSTVRYWDLRYFFDIRSFNDEKIPSPNKIAVNGKAAHKMYIQGGYPQKDLVDVEALRYLYLNKINNKDEHFVFNNNKSIQILVLGDYLAKNTHHQISILEKSFPYFSSNVKIIVKPHTNCPIIPSDYPKIKMKISMDPLRTLLKKCHVAYTSNLTSAAIDAYCVGLPVISCINPNSLNMSPLRSYGEVDFISTEDELVNALKKIVSKPRKNIDPTSFFWLDHDLSRWKKLLES